MKFLKNSFYFFFLTLVFISCKKDSNNNANDPKAENLKTLGASAEDILSDDIYSKIKVEFAYVEGFRPKQESIDLFRTLLEQRINKPGGITFVENVLSINTNATLTLNKIKEIEAANRENYTTDNTIALYFYFAEGNSSNDTQTAVTLGTAYRNTSMVVYEKTLRDLSSSFGTDLGLLESTTIHHEFGHILGLVNINNDDIHQIHEDPASNHHCIVNSCLMYYETTRRPVASVRNLLEVPVFDPLCIEDLQARGGK
ncbi:MAG: hypothetical protein ACWA45_07775 [Flavobacteriales bacterium]